MEDFDIDDILKNKPKKKKKNSKRIGKDAENELVKILNKRFPSLSFSRTVGSGNRWASVKQVSKDFIGDLTVPLTFRFSIECKKGYDLDLCACFQKNKTLDTFMKQASEDAERANRIPLVCWKKNHQPWLVFLPMTTKPPVCRFSFSYDGWIGMSLNDLLLAADEFFVDHHANVEPS